MQDSQVSHMINATYEAWKRQFWYTWATIRHPFYSYVQWRKWQQRPAVGSYVLYHGTLPLKVVGTGATGDDLLLQDDVGKIISASWMHCCEKASDEWGPKRLSIITYGEPGYGHSYLYGQEPDRVQPTSKDKFYDIRTGREIKRD